MKAVYEMPRVHFEAFASNVAVAGQNGCGGSGNTSDNSSHNASDKTANMMANQNPGSIFQNLTGGPQKYFTSVWSNEAPSSYSTWKNRQSSKHPS